MNAIWISSLWARDRLKSQAPKAPLLAVETFIRPTADLVVGGGDEAAAVERMVPAMRRATHRNQWRDKTGRHDLVTASRWTVGAVVSKAGTGEMKVLREDLTVHDPSTRSRTNHADPKF